MNHQGNYRSALSDFRRARLKANLSEISARLRGEPVHLLSYDEVRQKLKAQIPGKQILKDIPLNQIVGSVNRYEDFTRGFLPRSSISRSRWSHVSAAEESPIGLPPIETYQIGEVYFVRDGNHRVSIARQNSWPTIQGYVTEIRSRVPIKPDITPDELILKSEYVDFLEYSGLDLPRPEASLDVTAPGEYINLQEHISVHRYYMGIERKREVSIQEAAVHWFDTYYVPVVRVIRCQGILKDFPGRTETDLYLWVVEHRSSLESTLGESIDEAAAAIHLAAQYSPTLERLAARLGKKLKDRLTPDSLDAGPPVGSWRKERSCFDEEPSRLFGSILVPVNGKADGWFALEQALIVAECEQSTLHGLHVVHKSSPKIQEQSQAVQEQFAQRCAEAGKTGKLVVDVGEVERKISERAAWSDLVVVNLSYPPGPQPFSKLSSGFRSLVLRCACPILVTPRIVSPLKRALLAYDGSPKSTEALYIAAYLVGKWQIDLTVLTVLQPGFDQQTIQAVSQHHLENYHIEAHYRQATGPIDTAILIIAEEENCDFVIMGGYGSPPLVNALLDTVVDRVLRSASRPMLLCR